VKVGGERDFEGTFAKLAELHATGPIISAVLTYGRKTCAQQGHAGGRRERGVGGAGTRKRVGDLERRGNELV
jgi:hypothetical protein